MTDVQIMMVENKSSGVVLYYARTRSGSWRRISKSRYSAYGASAEYFSDASTPTHRKLIKLAKVEKIK